MLEYHKIQTVFKRDPATRHKTIIPGAYTLPEFAYLKDNLWEFSEKVDGTNVRVNIKNGVVTFGGRTDRAQMPVTLIASLQAIFPDGCLDGIFSPDDDVTLYGEGYGAKSQNAGGNYRPDQGFVLFDAMINGWWISRENLKAVAVKMGLDVVPLIGAGTLADMVDMARAGIRSQWGDFEAEGIVARPAQELRARDGSRIITKIKCRDFRIEGKRS